MTSVKPNPRLDFLSPLSKVPGLGAKRVAALKESGLCTIGDLLYYFPRRYIDRSTIVPIAQLQSYLNQTCTLIGTITQTKAERGRKPRFRIQISDNTGTCEALWFHGINYFRNVLTKGKTVLLHGKIVHFHSYQMFHPMVESMNSTTTLIPYLPQYSITESMHETFIQQKILFSAISWILKNLTHYPQILPDQIEQKKNFPALAVCLQQIHVPSDPGALEPFYNRLRYEELYQLALTLRWSKRIFSQPGRSLNPGILPGILISKLPFTLTDDQRTAIDILYSDAASSKRMHRLLQGDVGCGKTIVAFFATLAAINEGLQVAWLAPTEILARQTHFLVSQWLKTFDIQAGLISGGLNNIMKQDVLAGIRSGSLQFVVGTHSLFQPSVTFKNLGMIVIDEQHKFGANQRLCLQQKDPASDFLLLSATPIPQTLAQTLYGDLDTVTIRSQPNGRQKVSTHLVPENKRTAMETFILKEITKNNSQVFYLVPRIEYDEHDSTIKDISTVFDHLKCSALSNVPIAVLHGKLDDEEKKHIMQNFAAGDIKILVTTTVVEVGIDIPNATIMVIENAERFGLSQLHQLRGRVGRGSLKAFTFLLTQPTGNENTLVRLKHFCAMHDGFAIADLDLSLRGPGEVTGFRQSGWDELKVADILNDADIFREINRELDVILAHS